MDFVLGEPYFILFETGEGWESFLLPLILTILVGFALWLGTQPASWWLEDDSPLLTPEAEGSVRGLKNRKRFMCITWGLTRLLDGCHAAMRL